MTLPAMLQPAMIWLADMGLATGIARSATVYALVSASHVLGIACLVGPVLLADLRLAGWLKGIDAAAFAVLRRMALLGLLLASATGLLLFTARPQEYAVNPVIWAKVAVVAAGVVNAIRFERLWRHEGALVLARGAPGFGLFSAASWVSALLLGRWIAFV
jgi:hypothetical protein